MERRFGKSFPDVPVFHCPAVGLKTGLDLLEDLKAREELALADIKVYIDGSKEQAWLEENELNLQVFACTPPKTQMLLFQVLELESE